MKTKRRSGHRKTKPKGLDGRNVRANHAALRDEAELVAAHQRQICELELTLTRLRERSNVMNTAIEELSLSRTHFEELFEYAPAGYIVHDVKGAIQELNRAAAAMLEIRQGGYDHGSLTQFVPREELALWLEHVRRCTVERRATTELSLRGRNGKPVHVQVTTFVNHGSSTNSFRTVLSDITHARSVQAELIQAQEEYQRLIDAVEGIVWEANSKTLDFTFVSRYAERLLGYPVEEWKRAGFWYDRIYPKDRDYVANQIARAMGNRQDVLIEYRVMAADRRLVWLHDNVTSIERSGERRLLGVAIDVSERRQAEEKLRQTHDLLEERVAERTAKLRDSVADLEAFSYSLSHDMRSPLRAMQGYAALLEGIMGNKLGPEPLEYVRRIMRSSERLDALVQDVLNYGRIARAPPGLKPVALDGLMENILNDYPALTRARAQIEVRQPLLPVYGHDAFIGQALSNLLTNAVKFMPPGRTLRVRVWTEEVHRENGAAQGKSGEAGPWVRIWVEDNGIGIAPEDQKRVFRIFERIHSADKYEGTGIGLAIVQKAIERMGGRVGVQSAAGHGSKFWVELRRA